MINVNQLFKIRAMLAKQKKEMKEERKNELQDKMAKEVCYTQEDIDRLERMRGGECKVCGSWVCPPLVCFSCQEHKPDQSLINITAELEETRQNLETLKQACKDASEYLELMRYNMQDSTAMINVSIYNINTILKRAISKTEE